ncbi:hypothetical protein PMAYCL1PPCAC_00278 [Pristionchus mayeri]|uniref:Uncharacterized protein n=1 Tax=Pristionchus mayeri TaxID=1317129 RepID=A0AAN4YX35_9BILA|nr:hypothetical protein PMAYCL1PPCAC_00278 [Pristionchus mayeri]
MVRKVVSLFSALQRPAMFGMIHVPALPGTPGNTLTVPAILDVVKKEAEIYTHAGVDGIVVENMHDLPYVRAEKIGPEIVSSMSMACSTVASVCHHGKKDIVLGVQILAGANREAMAVAHATGFDFIRAEGFVFSHVADEGWMDACAGDLLRYRRMIGADNVAVFTDLKKKHCAHAVTADVPLGETAKAAEFFNADGVILTGVATGSKANSTELKELVESTTLPVLIGSGIDVWNVKEYREAKAFIVGSSLKKNGEWRGELCADKVKRLVHATKRLY